MPRYEAKWETEDGRRGAPFFFEATDKEEATQKAQKKVDEQPGKLINIQEIRVSLKS